MHAEAGAGIDIVSPKEVSLYMVKVLFWRGSWGDGLILRVFLTQVYTII